MNRLHAFLPVLSIFLFTCALNAQNSASSLQKVTGSPAEVKNALMSSNNVSFVMYNYGQFMRPNTLSGTYDLVWRGLGYMFEFGPLLAARVNDTLHIIDDGMWLPNQGGYAPDNSLKWGWLPRPGFANPASSHLATSNDPASWPSTWAAWPGKDGVGIVRSLNEAFSVMDDFTNAEFPYYPFPSDSSKRGLGVSTEVRTYQYGGSLRDAVIIEWKIKNESPKDLDSCYFGFYGDPHIGGSIDYADDLCNFLRSENTVYCWDADGADYYGITPGILNLQFLETPDTRGLTAFSALYYTNGIPNVPKNRPLFWSLLSADSIESDQELFTTPGDNVIVFGTGPFSLHAGDSTFVKLAIFFTEDTTALQTRAAGIRLSSHWPNIQDSTGSAGGDSSLSIRIMGPDSGIVAGNVSVSFAYTGTDAGAKVMLESSYDAGLNWKPVAVDLDPSQPFLWNTAATRDGVNYLLRAVAYSAHQSKFFYDITDKRLTVDNPGNAKPELSFDRSLEGSVQTAAPLKINWNEGDADNETLTITLSFGYSKQGPFTAFHSMGYLDGNQSYDWDFTALPNSDTYFLKITASDGVLDTSLVSEAFSIHQEKGSYPDTIFQHIAGTGTPDLGLVVINPWAVTGHRYEMTFVTPQADSTLLTVRDKYTGGTLIENWRLTNGISTPPFDGLELSVTNHSFDIDSTRSGFTRSALSGAVDYQNTGILASPQEKVGSEWAIAFNGLDTLADGTYVTPGDSIANGMGLKRVVAPFHIADLVSGQTQICFDPDPNHNGRWDAGESIVLIRISPITVYYQINFHFLPGVLPVAGDTLFVRTKRPLTSSDVFRFMADKQAFFMGVEETDEIKEFSISQNYPNPFNGIANFEIRIAKLSKVNLTVYDLLGRRVATLIDGVKGPGLYRVQWNSGSLPSGVFFFRLETGPGGSFVQTKKMLLLK